jgi:hypothetical protein
MKGLAIWMLSSFFFSGERKFEVKKNKEYNQTNMHHTEISNLGNKNNSDTNKD